MYRRFSALLPLRSLGSVRHISGGRNNVDFRGPYERQINNFDRTIPGGDLGDRRRPDGKERRGKGNPINGTWDMDNFHSPQNHQFRTMGVSSWSDSGSAIHPNSTFQLNLDVQGFNPEDIKITLKEGMLKISGHRLQEAAGGEKFRQSFIREHKLPENLNESSLKSYIHENGVLAVEGLLEQKGGALSEIPVQQFSKERESGSGPNNLYIEQRN